MQTKNRDVYFSNPFNHFSLAYSRGVCSKSMLGRNQISQRLYNSLDDLFLANDLPTTVRQK